MADIKYQLDVSLIREELETRGNWSIKRLAAEAKIGKRTLTNILSGEAVTYCIAERIANALGWTVIALTEKYLRAGPAWLDVPDLTPALEKPLVEALYADMSGQHEQAVKLCRQVLHALPKDDVEWRPYVRVKLATILDNGGKHDLALNELEAVLRLSRDIRLPRRVRFWVEYHRALCLRRLGRLVEAEAAFKALSQTGDSRNVASATHQLGVVYLQLAKCSKSKMRDAIHCLEKSRDNWRRAGNHREGFSVRRLAEAALQAGDLTKAVRLYACAIAIFARYECARYVEECTEALVDLIPAPKGNMAGLNDAARIPVL